MKALLTLGALLLCAAPALADHHGEAPAMPEMGMPAEMAALDFFHGDWDVAMEFKMDPTAAEWTKTTGTAKVEPVLDGCANRMTFESEIMGIPFRGMDHTTYNREYDRYESVWIDDMSGKMSVMHGHMKDGKFVMQGPDKMQGQEFLSRAVSEQKSDDEVYWSMSMSFDGGETWMENMRMTYTRK